MFKYILPIAFAFALFSCNSEGKSDSSDVTEIEDKDPKKVYDPSSVVSRSEEFFDWYSENSRMLYKMRSSCIGAENGYHALDKKKLAAYIDWLKETKFFSDNFIEFERNRWSTECADEMREMARKKKHFKGPPPCVFEGDIFFKIQERPTQEMIDSLKFTVAKQTDSSALVEIEGASSLNWSYKKGAWKIDAWP